MSTLSSYFRERIIRLWIDGENVSSIVKVLKAEGKETTQDTVRKWIYRWQQHRLKTNIGVEDRFQPFHGNFDRFSRFFRDNFSQYSRL